MGQLGVVARKRYWRDEDARFVVEAWRRSGRSIRQFARGRGVHPARLARWVKRLDGTAGGGMVFHPVRLLDGGGGGPADPIEVVLTDGTVVKVPEGFAEEELRKVMAVVRRTVC